MAGSYDNKDKEDDEYRKTVMFTATSTGITAARD